MLDHAHAAMESAVPVPASPPDTASGSELQQEFAARAGLYRLFGAVFVEEPGVQLLEALRSPETLGSLAEAGVRFDADLLEGDLDSLRDRLACEYAVLFVTSGGFPPIESVRIAGRLQQEPYHQVRQDYRRLGYKVVAGRHHVFEDQLGVELLFVAELLDRAAASLARGEAGEAQRLEREIKRFWALHLGRWARGYARLIARAAEHSLYREMAAFLADFAESEITAMRLNVEDVDQGRLRVPKIDPKVEVNPNEPVCNGCAAASFKLSSNLEALR